MSESEQIRVYTIKNSNIYTELTILFNITEPIYPYQSNMNNNYLFMFLKVSNILTSDLFIFMFLNEVSYAHQGCILFIIIIVENSCAAKLFYFVDTMILHFKRLGMQDLKKEKKSKKKENVKRFI